MPSSAREEAERLVAAVLAMASTGAGQSGGGKSDGTGGGLSDSLGVLGDLVGKVAGAALGHGSGGGTAGAATGGGTAGTATGGGAAGSGATGNEPSGGGWATGSAECCVCPVCRVIAAMRDPSPDAAARLAIGAGDLAHGVSSMMRALSAIAGERPSPPAKPAPQRPSPDEAWSAATRKDRGDASRDDVNNADEAWAASTNGATPDPETDPWGAASAASAEAVRAERRAAAKAAADAAAEAARRVEEAAAQARAAREAAQAKQAAARAEQEAARSEHEAARGAARTAQQAGPGGADVVQNTTPEVAPPGRTPQRFDVWAAATAADLEREPDVDHDDRDGEGDLS